MIQDSIVEHLLVVASKLLRLPSMKGLTEKNNVMVYYSEASNEAFFSFLL